LGNHAACSPLLVLLVLLLLGLTRAEFEKLLTEAEDRRRRGEVLDEEDTFFRI